MNDHSMDDVVATETAPSRSPAPSAAPRPSSSSPSSSSSSSSSRHATTTTAPDFFVPILTAEALGRDDDGGVGRFFREHVRARRPCVLDFHPAESDERRRGRPPLRRADLIERAGNDEARVEKRPAGTDESFGKERSPETEETMTVREFLRRLTTEERERYYLSTQLPPNDDDDDEEEADPFATTPVRQLRKADLVPERLDLAGGLALSACNMWIGSSLSGSSSGLHHDHHDNFYLLLEGSKRFRLYSPDLAAHMETHGTVERVHFNGRISYVGDERRPDGTPVLPDDDDDDDGEEADFHFDNEVSDDDDDDMEAAADRGDVDDYDEMMKEEQEKAMNDGDEDDEKEFVFGKGHDYESDGSDDVGMEDRGDVDDYDELMKNETEPDNNDDDDEDAQKHPATTTDATTAVAANQQQRRQNVGPPDNFSRVPPSALSDSVRLKRDFPNFAASSDPFVVLLSAGQTLYLPTGWFHEVTSLGRCHGAAPHGFDDDDESAGAGTHAALNYWYHPPDDLDRPERPYQSDHWRKKGWLV